MSTVIDHGYRIWVDNFDDAIKALKSPKEEMKQKLIQMSLKETFLTAIKLYDINILMRTCLKDYETDIDKNLQLSDDNLKKPALSSTCSIMREQLVEEIKENNGRDSNQLLIYIYPEKFEENGKNYYLFTYHGEYEVKKAYFSQLGDIVQEYGYWNNTDKPSKVTKAQWQKRSDNWDIAIPSGIPKEDGLSLMISTAYKNILLLTGKERQNSKEYFKRITKKIDIENRVNVYLEDILINKVANDSSSIKLIDAHEVINHYMKCRSIVRKNELTEEQLIFKDKITNEIKAVLKDITYDQLLEPFVEEIEKAKTIYFQYTLDNKMVNKKDEKNKLKI